MVLLVIYNISLEMTGMSYCKSFFWFDRAGSPFIHKSIVSHDWQLGIFVISVVFIKRGHTQQMTVDQLIIK